MCYDNIVKGIVDDDVGRVVELLEKNTNEIRRIITNFKVYYLFYKTKSKEMVIALLDYFDVKSIFDITLILTSIINIAIMHGSDIEMIRRLTDRGGIIDDTDVRHVSPLFQSIKSKRDVNFIKEILKIGADVNEICDKDGNTILHNAVSTFHSGDDVEIIKLLIESGADTNSENSRRAKPLMELTLNANAHEDLWLELIERRLNICDHTAKNCLKDTFLTVVISKTSRIKQFLDVLIYNGFMTNTLNKVCNRFLYLALKNNCSTDCITEIIDKGASVNELKYLNEHENDYTTSPLLIALQFHRGNEIISVLLDKGADVNAIDKLGVTPLVCAINKNYDVEIIDKLINLGADVNKCDVNRVSPLMYAIKNGNKEITGRLIEAKADINAVDVCGRTSLHYAVIYFNDQDIIDLLIKNGADFSKINDCHDRFWFYIEFVKRSDKFFADLILRINNVNTGDEFGQTFLMYAIELNMNKNIIFSIIFNVAEINAIDYRGYTPLIYAIKYECDVDVIINLIEHGADVNVIDNNGLTPIKHAVHSSMYKEVIQILTDNGVNINSHDENNSTVLLYILKYVNNNKELVSFLIHEGADVNICDNQGLTPLMYAILYGAKDKQVEIATALIENGACIDACDVQGYTALHYAFSFKNDKYLCLLLDYGASVEKFMINLDEGKTPLIYAVSHSADVQILIEFLHSKEDINEVNENDISFLNYLFTCHAELALLLISDHIEVFMEDTELVEKFFLIASDVYIKRLLFCCGLNINYADSHLRTPLNYALSGSRNVKLIKSILDNGGNAKLADRNRNTALHFTSSAEVINFLIVYGNADVSARNDSGQITCHHILFDTDCYGRRCVKMSVKHLLLVCPAELDQYSSVRTFHNDFLEECYIELKKMKSTDIVDNLTFYKFCYKLSRFEMNLISQSDNFCAYSYEQIEKLFPIYFDVIILKIKKCKIDLSKRRLIKALERLIITNRVVKSYDPKKYESNLNNCCSVEHSDEFCECIFLNYDIIYFISKYLDDSQVVNLLLASL